MLILLFLFLDSFVNIWPLGIQRKWINLFYLLFPISFLPSYSLDCFYLLECVICCLSLTSIHSSFILFSSIMFIWLKFLYYYFLEILILYGFPPFIFFHVTMLYNEFHKQPPDTLLSLFLKDICADFFSRGCHHQPDTKLDISGKYDSQLSNFPHQTGLWICLWGVF